MLNLPNVAISHMTIPNAQISVSEENIWYWSASGAIHRIGKAGRHLQKLIKMLDCSYRKARVLVNAPNRLTCCHVNGFSHCVFLCQKLLPINRIWTLTLIVALLEFLSVYTNFSLCLSLWTFQNHRFCKCRCGPEGHF